MNKTVFRLAVMFLAVMLAAPVWAAETQNAFGSNFYYYVLERPIPYANQQAGFTLDDFAVADSQVYMRKANADFSAGFVPFLASAKGSTYEVRMVYSKYSVIVIGLEESGNTIKITDDKKADHLVFVDIGVQVFAQAMITDKGMKGGLSNFKGLALSAEKNKAEGTLGVRCVGIGGAGATVLVPTGLSLDEASVTIVTDAVSSIKGTMLNAETRINPCILGFQTTTDPQFVYSAMPQIIKYLKGYELTKYGFAKIAEPAS